MVESLECRLASTKRKKAYYDKHKALGLCTECMNPAAIGHVLCKIHLAKARSRDKADSERRKALGLCVRCGKPTFPSLTMCADCLFKRKAIVTRYYRNHSDKVNHKATSHRMELLEANRCRDCGAPLIDEETYRCVACRAKHYGTSFGY